MEIQKSKEFVIPAVYPIVADKVNIANKERVRIVEATSRNRDYNEYLDRMAEAERRESLYLYNRDRSVSAYHETGKLMDIET
jgi:hypothetical protein